MAFLVRVVAVLAIGALGIHAQGPASGYAPSNWCEDDALAKQVGVSQQCSDYAKATNNQRVNITLLYESLCGGCRNVITTIFKPLYPQLKDFVDFQFIPYGNAGPNGTGGYNCQHGEEECQLNQVETCALNYIKDQDTRFNFIICIESSDGSVDSILAKCFAQASVGRNDQTSISNCWNSPEGTKLEGAMADYTNNVFPIKHGWVPWLIINGASTHQDQTILYTKTNDPAALLTRAACEAYRGDTIPDACKLPFSSKPVSARQRRVAPAIKPCIRK